MKIIGIPIEDIQTFLADYSHTILKVIVVIISLIFSIDFIKKTKDIHNPKIVYLQGDQEEKRNRNLLTSLKIVWHTQRQVKVYLVIVVILFVAVFGYFTTTSKTLESERESNLGVIVFYRWDGDGTYYFKTFKQYYPDTNESAKGNVIVPLELYYSASTMTEEQGFTITDNNIYLDKAQKFKLVQSDQVDFEKLCYEEDVSELKSENSKCLELTLEENTIELPYTTRKYEVKTTTNYLFGLLQFENELDERYIYEYEIYLPSE